MKKEKKTRQYRPFDNEIKQMRKEKVILVAGIKVKPFAEECVKRGIELKVGSAYNGGIIFFEK